MHVERSLALITGASSGLGVTFARHLASRGYDVMLVARRKDRLAEAARALEANYQVRAEILAADLTCDADLRRVEDYIASTSNLEFLVNNAGFGMAGRFVELPLEGQRQMHRLHVLAPMRLAHAALTGMVARQRGSLVNVSSVSAFGPSPGSISYSATKAWMNSFTEGLYVELKSTGSPVRVQALCPGFTITEFHDAMHFDRQWIPGWLWMQADEVVAASLRGLDRGQWCVIPGRRYRALVFLMRALPRGLYHRLAIRYARDIRRQRAATGH